MRRITNKAAMPAIVIALLCVCLLAGCAANSPAVTKAVSGGSTSQTEANVYNVTFDAQGGSETPSQQVRANEKAAAPTNPTKAGYVFAGWTCGEEAWSFAERGVTGDTVLTANWEPAIVVSDEGVLTGITAAGKAADSLVIPAVFEGRNVTTIGTYAFLGCGNLINLTIQEGVLYLNSYAFMGCSSLERISLPNSLTDVRGFAFSATEQLSYSTYDNAEYLGNAQNPFMVLVRSVGADIETCAIHPDTKLITGSAFAECTHLSAIEIPVGVRTIGASAFKGCTALRSARIAGSVKEIGASAFEECATMTALTIGEGVQVIGERAFADCVALNELALPVSLTRIGEGIAAGCSSLQSVTLPFVGEQTVEAPGGLIPKTTFQHTFGYMFGREQYAGSVSAVQRSYNSQSSMGRTYYLPATLKTVTFTGDKLVGYAFKDCRNLTEVRFTENLRILSAYAFEGCTGLTHVTIPEGTTNIGNSAFSGCTNLVTVSVPDTIVKIGQTAFGNCTNLVYNVYENAIYLGNEQNPYVALMSVVDADVDSCTVHNATRFIAYYAFSNCKNIDEIVIPDSVAAIGPYAFSRARITSVTIGRGIRDIPEHAFEFCAGLRSVTVLEGVTHISEQAFYWCTALTSITLPDSVREIEKDAFLECSALETVSMPSGITFLSTAFRNCTALTFNSYDNGLYIGNEQNPYLVLYKAVNTDIENCVIHEDVKILYDSAFRNCTKLTDIEIPAGVTCIEYGAFSGCTGLTSVVIPDGVTRLDNGVFQDCTNLVTVEIPDSLTYLGAGVFLRCRALTGAYVPAGVTKLQSSVFGYCSHLETVTGCENVTSIGAEAFLYCHALTGFEIPAGVTSIGASAFQNCNSLTNLVVPEGVTELSTRAFYGCQKLETLTIASTVRSIDTYAVGGTKDVFKDLYFNGTVRQWKSITKADYWGSIPRDVTVVHCIDGDVTFQ